jgi:hypothetical protein
MKPEEIREKWPDDPKAEIAAQLAEIKEFLILTFGGIALDIHALISNAADRRPRRG